MRVFSMGSASQLPLSNKTNSSLLEEKRRSANYHPTIWDSTVIRSFTTSYTYDFYGAQLEELKEKARKLVACTKDTAALLKLIDSLQRLGVAYHFHKQIGEALNHLYLDQNCYDSINDLFTAALHFRLLREHGYLISSDVFEKFKGGDGKFMDNLSVDVEELLCLGEASFLGVEGETILEEAKTFSSQSLNKILQGKMDKSKAKQVQKYLEVPLHWRMERIEARNFIDSYNKDSPILVELAKLDYNLIQSTYQQELEELTEWWRELNFKEKLSFGRDRLMEIYFWATGLSFEPHYAKCRICFTKYACLATIIDDIYDIYGSLDELESFTNVVTRWDVKAMEELPEYMRVMFSAMSEFTNELAQDTLRDHGLDVMPYIKEQWAILCKAHVTEARWFYGGHTPTFEEYVQNGWISIGSLGGLVLLSFVEADSIVDQFPRCLKEYSQIFYWSSLITRLSDDLGTSKAEMERGDIPKAMQSYMIEKGVSEEEARDHVKELINHCWKKINQEIVDNTFPQVIVNLSKNMARTAQYMYQHGDGVGTSTGVTKDCIVSSILEPISI